jgi:hypothetical protein
MSSGLLHEEPLKRLKGKLAQPADLRGYSRKEEADRTCRYCDLTYTGVSTRRTCELWHLGRVT